MWGEVLEEDLYDENTPFYDDELAMKEAIARQEKMEAMNVDPNRKLKRKVIYVYEKNEAKSENPYSNNLQKAGSQMVLQDYPSSKASGRSFMKSS